VSQARKNGRIKPTEQKIPILNNSLQSFSGGEGVRLTQVCRRS
jgi:hypothetical protein